jgi:hypothetical protein
MRQHCDDYPQAGYQIAITLFIPCNNAEVNQAEDVYAKLNFD